MAKARAAPQTVVMAQTGARPKTWTRTRSPLEGACPQETRHGVFEVESNEDYAAVVGEVANAVLPTSVLTELLTEGDCTIWRRGKPLL